MQLADKSNNSRPVRPFRPAGIGLRSSHYEAIVEQQPDIGWIEVHPENFFGGGLPRYHLSRARELYPLSLHAVGLSLGSDQPVSRSHLRQLKELIDIYEPFQVSDHASWSATGNAHLQDLLPLPYTAETLQRLCDNIEQVQTFINRTILVENPSTYVSFDIDEMTEYEFMNAIAEKTGCSILLDVNNIFVQSFNHNFDPYEYLDHINPAKVGEIHLAGHTERKFDDGMLLVDTHDRPVRPEVWDMYQYTITRLGDIPTLIEWDGDIPELEVLVAESDKAQLIIDSFIPQEKMCHAAE